MANDIAAVVMAGGLGTRMKSAVPKHLHALLGRRMVDWVIGAARDAGASRDGDVLVLNGDVPALTSDLLADLLATHRAEGAAATVLSFEPPDLLAYGRI